MAEHSLIVNLYCCMEVTVHEMVKKKALLLEVKQNAV